MIERIQVGSLEISLGALTFIKGDDNRFLRGLEDALSIIPVKFYEHPWCQESNDTQFAHAQTKLAQCAANGLQIIVWSMSEHVFNAIRVSVKKEVLLPSQVVIHYLRSEGEAFTLTSPEIDEYGKLNKWPVGFFDTWDNALDTLLSE